MKNRFIKGHYMSHCLEMLINALGQSQSSSMFELLKTQLTDNNWVEVGDNAIFKCTDDGLTLTFNVDDILSKIEMLAPKKYFQLWIESNVPSMQGLILKPQLIKALGTPVACLEITQQSKQEIQLLYNKIDYWLSIKCQADDIVSVTLLIPSLIPDSIRYNQVPIRTSHSKN
ncbi:MAG: hypothetical protein AB7I18_01835 [Candidatus Berkiella sp.]